MKTAHTPAPWRVFADTIQTGGLFSIKIAEVMTRNEAKENWEANARLIAVAPELLEACNYISYASEGIAPITGDLINEEAYQITVTGAALKQLREAIAKAKG